VTARRLGWGILGTGDIAHSMADDLLRDGARVAAVGSRSAGSADRFAAEFGIGTSHENYEALVADPEVDIVYIASPHPFHAEHAELAIAAGKHVLVEKPFAMNAVQSRRMRDSAHARGVRIMEAMWTRWLPHMVRTRQIIASGVLGELRTVIADHGQRLPSDPAHRIQDPLLGGGALLDLGIYPVSLAHDLFGVPETIAATSTFTATGVDRQTAVLLGYDDGATAVLHTALDAAGPNRATIIGTAARIEIDAIWYTPATVRVIDVDGRVLDEFDGRVPGGGMQFEARAMERLVESVEPDDAIMPVAESIAVLETLDSVRALIGLRYPGESG
jgi:predicted dehydrogenase